MRILFVHGVFAMQPGIDRKADGLLAKRAGWRWHSIERNHPRDCDGCAGHVPDHYWFTTKVEVAARLYEHAKDNPDQAPETLALLLPHVMAGLGDYEGPATAAPPTAAAPGPHLPDHRTVVQYNRDKTSWLDRASGDDNDED